MQRISFRRAMKSAPFSPRCAQGPKESSSNVAGRLGGAEIARTEGYNEGRVPLHTLRADIDYAQHSLPRPRPMGTVGVKCWIFKGEVVDERQGRTYSAGGGAAKR